MWYKIETPSGSYWTPFPEAGHEFIYPNWFDDSANFHPQALAKYRENADKICQQDAYRKILESRGGVSFAGGAMGLVMTADKVTSDAPQENPPPGYFRYLEGTWKTPERLMLAQQRNDEKPVVMSEGVFESVREDIQNFVDAKPIYEDAGAHYRMGILAYGPPGNGKSTLIRQILNDHPALKTAVKITCPKLPEQQFLEQLSALEAIKVFIFEELYMAVKEPKEMARMLNFLDGEDSVRGAIILATTNYPEKLPGNIIDRPSRFDKLYRFGLPNGKERKALMSKILGRTATSEEVNATTGFSAAYVREAALQARVKRLPVSEVVKALRKRMEEIKKDFSSRAPIGLHGKHDFSDGEGPEDKAQGAKPEEST